MGSAGNKVRFNLKNVYYSMLTVGEDGTVTFAPPVRIHGAVSLALSPQGSTKPFFAEGVAYYVAVANNGYSGDFTVAMVPDSFRKEALGEVEDATSKVLVEYSNVEVKPFALLFEFDGDQKSIRHVMYNCTAARPNMEGSTTTEDKSPATEKLSLTAAPLEDGTVKAKTGDETTAEVYDKWYKSVWRPGAAVTQEV